MTREEQLEKIASIIHKHIFPNHCDYNSDAYQYRMQCRMITESILNKFELKEK